MFHKSNYENMLSLCSDSDLINPLRRRSSNSLNNVDFANEEQVFPYFLACLKKNSRSNKENQIIMYYIKKMTEFLNLIKNSHENQGDLLIIIASCLGHFYIPANKILFRIGDKGDRFYIILKGKVSILILKEINIMMSEEEYFNFIQTLIINRETHILNLCLHANDQIYSFNDINSPKRRNTRHSLKITYVENKNEKEISSIEHQNSAEFIENLKPKINETLHTERKVVKLWIYLNFITLGKGDYFGDTALTYTDQKRTATIYIDEECHFGVLDKDSYDKCIKEANENQILSNVIFLLSTHIFCEFSQKYFKLHYLNLFKKVKISIYDKLITEGHIPISTYIIKEGEYEISFRKSLIEINEYLRCLGDYPELELEEENSKMNFYPKFMKFMQERKLYRVSIVKSKEVVGLEDLIFDNKYGFTVECLSSKGEIYKIENKIFNMISEKEINFRITLDNLTKKRKNFIVDRLKKIKLSRLEFFSKNYENDIITSPFLSSKISAILPSRNTPKTNSYCIIDKTKPKDEKSSILYLDTNRSREVPPYTIANTKSFIFKNKEHLDVPTFISKNIALNNKESFRTTETTHIIRTNTDEESNLIFKMSEDDTDNCDNSYLKSKMQKNKFYENDASKSKFKIVNKNFKIISNKVDKEHKFMSSIKKKEVSEEMDKSLSSKDVLNHEQKENNLGFVKEYKLINECLKTEKNHFNNHLYQKLSSNYLSEQVTKKSKDSVNVVDFLALDNFNRIYSKASLPIICNHNATLKSNNILIKNKHKFFNKTKNIYLTKNKVIKSSEKAVQRISTQRTSEIHMKIN